jgi:O-acetyl-ADP-ribose deacetylase (regulator of RNase III)
MRVMLHGIVSCTTMAEITIKVGDVLDEVADVIISTANPWLNMSGGVNGAIRLRGGELIQKELHAYLREMGRPAVEPGTVVVTSPGPLKARQILHAVAIDPFYDSSVELVRHTLERAFDTARRLEARTVAMPTLATGYGHLSMEQFALALAEAMDTDWSPIEHLVVVVRKPDDADTIRRILEGKKGGVETQGRPSSFPTGDRYE